MVSEVGGDDDGISGEVVDARFEVEAGGDGDGSGLVTALVDDSGELVEASLVGAAGEADKEMFIDEEDIAAIEGAGGIDGDGGEVGLESGLYGSGFALAAGGAGDGDDSDVIGDDDGGIFDEMGIGESWLGGEVDDSEAAMDKGLDVGDVLVAGEVEVGGAEVGGGEAVAEGGGRLTGEGMGKVIN